MESTMIESRNKGIMEQAFFPVKKVRCGKNRYHIINMETKDKISTVSKIYALVKNESVVMPFIEKFGIQKFHEMQGYGKGKYYHFEFFTGREFNLGTIDGKDDIVKEKIIIKNSYDKSKSFEFIIGAYRMVCKNGLYAIAEKLLNYKKKHVGHIPIKSILRKVFKSCEKNSFETWHELAKIGLTLDQEIALIEKFEAKQIKKVEKDEFSHPKNKLNRKIRTTAIEYVREIPSIDNRRDGWGLYNQLNRSITDNIKGKSQIDTRIKVNQRVEQFLMAELNLN